MEKVKAHLVISRAKELVTCAGEGPEDLHIIQNGFVALGKNGRILGVGSEEEVLSRVDTSHAQVIDATGKVVVPGFVDCHTHLVFGGSRVEEYAAKLTVTDPEELARLGVKTGIMVTLEATRNASEEELYRQSSQRLENMLLRGTTTVESKSGYGLSTPSELSMLRVNQKLARDYPVDVVSTFLGAHGWPGDVPKEQYMETLKKEMIPAVAEEKLAAFCDIWCDDGHYTAPECRDILEAGMSWGLKPKIHTGAYSYIGGADLAAEMGMLSADHLNYTPREALKKLVAAGTVGVLLPGTDFAVKHPRPWDPQPMLEEGLTLALGTNCCPGCWCESMQFIMTLACRQHGLTPAAALKAATLGGAKALGVQKDKGSLEVGKVGDVQIWDVPRYEEAVYRLGGNVVEKVIKGGNLSVDEGKLL